MEIAYGKRNKPSMLLISGGAWSYSLYLFHGPAMRMFWKLRLPNLGYMPNWLVLFAFVLCLSYVFYLAVERPSHRLARMFRTTSRGETQPSESAAAKRSWISV